MNHPSLLAENPTISVKDLPPNDSAAFKYSSFFSRNRPHSKLPAPAQIRERALELDAAADCSPRPAPVRYEDIRLLVKFGREPDVTEGEAQCFWALRRVLPQVPVPEVYGWTHDKDQVFIYMELVRGFTLEEAWNSMSSEEKVDICQQLKLYISELRTLRHAPGEFFLGHINYEPLGCISFMNGTRPPAGPFNSVAEFHDWMSLMTKAGMEHNWPGYTTEEIPDPLRKELPDDSPVVFTHDDLHPSNIILSITQPRRIIALIDWRQSGWYPDYWEFCKAVFTVPGDGEWATEYIPRFLEEPNCLDTWEWYSRTFGY
ncbi:phosphotransferase enzyme family protein [Sodiomyces alkalinus F11]|uniref:Phosphotransferase enzyme family protein n=1 Tax=Sodiomyces alkalinus (strain CBS 110278 / VKM F-3762 / F11) TaxID=1314773 RepID=A0A3N2Q5Z8_SODAK|nr:phosphotransferase enzyme family protein [Sodiomyces alkalinus F11]ROT42204.1 phosphotransferase enzyme family protein [Sodiomyces alkalinus F11]